MDLPDASSAPLASEGRPLPASSSRSSSSGVSSSPLGSPLPDSSKGTKAGEGAGLLRDGDAVVACGSGCMWWRFEFPRLWVRVEKGLVIGGHSAISVSSILGGGRASTMLGWNGAGVVVGMVAAAVELGVVAGRLGVGRSAGSVMVSGGGKGRKQGMDE